jgi:hypothetical protein
MRDELAQDKVARATGGFYLGFILASFVADTAGHVGVSDPQQVYETIGTSGMTGQRCSPCSRSGGSLP